MSRRNEEVAHLLDNIAELLSIKGESPYRVRAYANAARYIGAMTEDVEAVSQAGKLDDIPGVGESIAAKIDEFLDTGRLGYYERLKKDVPVAAGSLLEVPGIGPTRAHRLYNRLGIEDVDGLLEAARAHRLRSLPGFGAKLEEKIEREAGRLSRRTRRMLLGTALPIAEEVVELLRHHPAVRALDPAGSIRRMKETVGDIDILVASDNAARVAEAFTSLPIAGEVVSRGPTRPSILTHDDIQVDLRIIDPNEYGSALQYFTGSKEHNIALRARANDRGWKLSEYGLEDEKGQRIAGKDEAGIYRALGLDWIPPELRENQGEIEADARHRLPELVTLEAIHGDLHVHTDWSDGHDTLEAMVEGAMQRGYTYLAIADHSPSLGIARGLPLDRVRRQREAIHRLNQRYAPFRVLHSTEVTILPDGDLDYPDEVLAGFDLVTASVHSHFGLSSEEMTERVVRALGHPSVDILGHPSGRLLLRRPPYELDLEAVLRAAAERGVAVEINGQPDRLDLDDAWSRRAQELGARLVLNSDAHSVRQLDFMRYAVATARRGWVAPATVLNALPLRALLSHLHRSHSTAHAPARVVVLGAPASAHLPK